MSDELKPCPFCGGNASISKDHDPDGSGAFYAVKCHKCRAKSSEIYAVETCNIHFTQVRDAWNRRADLADALAVPEVSEAPKIEPLGCDEWDFLRDDDSAPRADLADVLAAALRSAQQSIADMMGVHGYPLDSGAGEILREVNAALAAWEARK